MRHISCLIAYLFNYGNHFYMTSSSPLTLKIETPNFVHIRPRRGGGLLGKWVKYNRNEMFEDVTSQACNCPNCI